MSNQIYRHFQFATGFYVFLFGLAGIVVPLVLLVDLPISLVTVTVVLGALLVLFGGLAVTVDSEDVRLVFGVGLIRRTLKRADIESVEQVRNKWWYGLGIRRIPQGWLWCVSGLDAVQISYRDGGQFRIGTDDPEGLVRALRS